MLVSQTTRTKYSRSGDEEEMPIVFVSKPPPLIGRKTQRKMQSAVPTGAPVVVRSRTKKPTRLGVRDKKVVVITDFWSFKFNFRNFAGFIY